jgi:ABC-2 type transport system ATP-binding protein
MILCKNITKKFGQKVAVNDLSMEIPSGCITGFIGPNGAGKTTTIHMMTGVLPVETGEILLNGINISTDPLQAKKSFALVPDSPDIFLRLTGAEYINFIADLYEVDPAVRKERAERLAQEFGLSDVLGNQIETYSHGMRQKVIVVAALTCDPAIWILDEPMTGLDPQAAFLLKQKMREHAEKGNTVFFSTHVLEVAEKLCDKIVLIQNGSIKYAGTLEELKEQHADRSLEQIFLEVTA